MTSLVTIILSVLFYHSAKLIEACPPSLSSLNLPPPVIHMECLRKQNPCQAGYICRRNRCIAASMATKTENFDLANEKSEVDDESLLNPADHGTSPEIMETCCENHQLAPRCMSFCTMSNYNESSVFQLLSEPTRCPMTSLLTIHYCASQNRNHLKCCKEKFIPPNCQDLCLPAHPAIVFDESKLHCLQYISIMKTCFFRQDFYDD